MALPGNQKPQARPRGIAPAAVRWRSLKYEDIYLRGYEHGLELRQGVGKWFGDYNDSYGPGADPTPGIFKKFGRRKWKGQQLYFLDYVTVMLNEDHRGWLPEDLKKYRAAIKKGDNKQANKLLNIRAKKDAAFFLNWHRRRIEDAYNATASEKVRKKYRWLMKYHNQSFDNKMEYLCDEVIDIGKFPEPKSRKTERRKTAK